MTTKNAILLIVKQSPGIDYNSLLTKFAASYSNANSARAALSRSLKDLTVFGFLSRKDNKYYLLDRGEAEIYSELKNKLMLALNSVLREKRPVNEIDSIVEKLQILIERGRQDKDLLKTSKSSLDFSVSDLEAIQAQLDKKVKHLEYLSKVYSEQVNTLKELDFKDSYFRQPDAASFTELAELLSSQPEQEFLLECHNIVVLEALAQEFDGKIRNDSFPVQKSQVHGLIDEIGKRAPDFTIEPVTIFSSVLKAQVFSRRITLSGPYSEVAKWKQPKGGFESSRP